MYKRQHITVGVPPTLRINGELVETDFQRMMPPDTEAFADGLMNEKQKQEVETSGQADFAYSLKEFGRYRVKMCIRDRVPCAVLSGTVQFRNAEHKCIS